MSQDISQHLQGLTTNDVHIDSLGRAVITNPATVAKLSAAGVPSKGAAAAGNIICTGSSPAASRELLQSLHE